MRQQSADELGETTLAAARAKDAADEIAAATQLPKAVVQRTLDDAELHGKTKLRNVFAWPDADGYFDAENLGQLTARQALLEVYLPAVAKCAGLSQAEARRQLRNVAPNKRVENVFAEAWPTSTAWFDSLTASSALNASGINAPAWLAGVVDLEEGAVRTRLGQARADALVTDIFSEEVGHDDADLDEPAANEAADAEDAPRTQRDGLKSPRPFEDGPPGPVRRPSRGDTGRLLTLLEDVRAYDLRCMLREFGIKPRPSKEENLTLLVDSLLDGGFTFESVLSSLLANDLSRMCEQAGLPTGRTKKDNAGSLVRWFDATFTDPPDGEQCADKPATGAPARGADRADEDPRFGGPAASAPSSVAAFEDAFEWCEAVTVATPAAVPGLDATSPWAALVKHHAKLDVAFVSLGGLRSEPAALEWLQHQDRLRVIAAEEGPFRGDIFRLRRGGEVRVFIDAAPNNSGAPTQDQHVLSWTGTEFDPFAVSVEALLAHARERAHVPTRDELAEYRTAFVTATERWAQLVKLGEQARHRAYVEALKPDGWPSPEERAFMMKHYKRMLTWAEWWKERSDRMAPDASSLAYDADGVMTF
jgi:hypothetical protein